MDSKGKPRLSKPLNPNAKSFEPANAKTSNDGPKNVEQMPVEHTQPVSDKMMSVSPQKVCYFSVHVHSEPKFLQNLTWMVTGYPIPYQPLGSGFYDTSLHHRKMSKAEKRIVGQRPGRMCMERRRMVDSVPKRVEKKWMVKGDNKKSTSNTGVRPIIPFPHTLDEVESSGITTAMIRNVPNQFRYLEYHSHLFPFYITFLVQGSSVMGFSVCYPVWFGHFWNF